MVLIGVSFHQSSTSGYEFSQLQKIYSSNAPLKTLALSHSGDRVAFSTPARDTRGDIIIYHFATGKRKLVTTDDALDSQPVWAPGDTQVYFFSNREKEGGIYVSDLETKQVKRVSPSAVWCEFPDLSPDGKRLVYYCRKDKGYNLYELNLDTGKEVQLTSGEHFNFGPRYAARHKILFYSKRQEDFAIYELDTRTGKVSSMPGPGGFTFQPTPYIDNENYFCVSNLKGANDLYLVSRSGNFKAVHPSASQDLYPVYSKPQKKLYFISQREGDYAIFSTTLQ